MSRTNQYLILLLNLTDFISWDSAESYPQMICQEGLSLYQTLEQWVLISKYTVCNNKSWPLGGVLGGGGLRAYMGYVGMCRCEGYGFQEV